MATKVETPQPPRTRAATAARMRTHEQKLAEKLRARGWTVIEPKQQGPSDVESHR